MSDDIDYFFLKESDFDEVVAFLTEDFFQREPVTLGSSANEKCKVGEGRMGEDIRRGLRSGVSVGARDRKTGQMVGARVSAMADRANPHKPTQPANEFETLYRVLDLVLGQVFVVEKVDKVLMMLLLSVRKEYGARGIAGKMVLKCMEAGHAKGATLACTCITNILSGKTFLKLGYETRYTLDFEEPNHGYEVDLSKMYGNKTVRLMTKTLP